MKYVGAAKVTSLIRTDSLSPFNLSPFQLVMALE